MARPGVPARGGFVPCSGPLCGGFAGLRGFGNPVAFYGALCGFGVIGRARAQPLCPPAGCHKPRLTPCVRRGLVVCRLAAIPACQGGMAASLNVALTRIPPACRATDGREIRTIALRKAQASLRGPELVQRGLCLRLFLAQGFLRGGVLDNQEVERFIDGAVDLVAGRVDELCAVFDDLIQGDPPWRGTLPDTS